MVVKHEGFLSSATDVKYQTCLISKMCADDRNLLSLTTARRQMLSAKCCDFCLVRLWSLLLTTKIARVQLALGSHKIVVDITRFLLGSEHKA